MASSDPLIDKTRVPDLAVLALQQALNARVRAGTLSGPLLNETGALDAATEAKQREQEAYDTLVLATLQPERPTDPADWDAAREADQALLEQWRQELALIPDTPYLDFAHKAPSEARLKKLVAHFQTKWHAAQTPEAQIVAILGEFPAPGSLRLADNTFDYERLQQALTRLQRAEQAHSEHPHAGLDTQNLLANFRQHLAHALLPITATPAVSAPAPLSAAAPESIAPAKQAVVTQAPVDPFAPNPVWERMGREMDTWGPEQRAQLIREGLTQSPVSEQVPRLVHSLLRTHPGLLTPAWLDALDGYACRTLGADTQRVDGLPPRLRLALVKSGATQDPSPAGQAKNALASTCALSLIAEHPRAALEILTSPAPEAQAPLMVGVLASLDDQVITSLGKDALHALSKRLSAHHSAEQRRTLARLVRLMGQS